MKKQDHPVILEEEITLEDRVIPYKIRRSSKAKNVRLKIGEGTRLEIVVPENYPLANVSELLHQKEKWILSKLQFMEELAAQKKAALDDAFTKIRYLGKDYWVVVILDNSSPIRIELKEEKAYLTLPQNRDELIKQVIEAWYRWAARSLFEERVNLWAEKMHVSYNTIFVKNQKTRWGSCSRRKNLSFNLRIIMAPLEVVDYIIIHELAHLKEMNHSKRFWQVLEEYCPGYKKHLEWLKKYGPGLVL